jgi:predicted porin
MGSVRIGYQYTALYELATLSGYAVGSEGIPGADKGHLHGQVGVGGTRANMVQYISPNFGGGFTARVQYGAGTGRESVDSTAALSNGLTSDKQRRMAAMLTYANGPVSLGAAYTNLQVTQNNVIAGVNSVAGATTSVYGVVGTATTFNAATGVYALPANLTAAQLAAVQTGQTRTANLLQLGASYDFGVAKLGATYNRGKNGGLATTAAAAAGVTALNYDYRAYQFGVSVPFGAIVPFLAYGRATTDTNAVNGAPAVGAAAATGRIEEYKHTQFGVRYSLSKRTTAYAFYGQTTNNAAAQTGAVSFHKDSKTVVGVAHSF